MYSSVYYQLEHVGYGRVVWDCLVFILRVYTKHFPVSNLDTQTNILIVSLYWSYTMQDIGTAVIPEML